MDDRFDLVSVQTSTGADGAKEFEGLTDPLVIMSGCAGNKETVTPNLQLDSLTDNAVPYIQCYAEITFDADTFTHTLYASANSSILDKSVLRLSSPTPPPAPGGFQSWTLLLPVAFAAFVLTAFIASKFGVRTTPPRSADGMVYSKVSVQVPTSTLTQTLEGKQI